MDQNTLVQHLLSVIGEGGVSPTNNSHPSVIAAKEILEATDLDFQQIGWWFNTSYRLTLLPNSDGKVVVPASALSVTVSDVPNMQPTEKRRYVRRGGFMFDTYKNSNVIDRSLVINLVVRLSYEELPPQAASYLKHKAAEDFYLDDDGDEQKLNRLARRTSGAWSVLKAEHLKIMAVSALDTPHAQMMRSGISGVATRGFNRLDGGSQ